MDVETTERFLDLLGRRVRDRVTGYEGIVESVSWDLYGCIQAVVRPPVDDKGAMPDAKWLDVLRLIELAGDRVMEVPGGAFANYGTPHGPAEKPAR